jgi:hypothetical protein
LGLERSFGVPGQAGLNTYKAVLPLESDLEGEENEGAAVNQSGFLERGVPGAKGGKSSWSLSLTTGTILEFLEHLLGGVTKTTLAAGIYQYAFVPTRSGVSTSFYALLSKSPVLRAWLYSVMFSKLSLSIGDNVEIAAKLEGMIGHGTRMGAGAPDEDNTGSYSLGPHLRGVLKNPAAGSVYVRVTRVTGGLQFKVEQTLGSPTFAGAAVDVVLDGPGEATYQNLQGADGLDLGLWTEIRDPLEIIWPGSASDHADLDVGDTWVFAAPGTWLDPAVPSLAGFQRFTSAHWTISLRTVGASTWTTMRCRKGDVDLEWPLSEERGNGSRYPFLMLRDGLFKPTLKLERALVDPFFADRGERALRLEAELAFQGAQLSAAYRESIRLNLASSRIDEPKRSVKDSKTIAEEVTLVGETNDDGDPPASIVVVTSRNWTPSVA